MKNRFLHYLDKVLGTALVVSASAMVLIVLLQILSRFALPWSVHWTEEMARFCFIYMTSLGAGLAIKDNVYVGVETFINMLPERARFYMECVILLATGVLMLIMFVSAFPLFQVVKLQTSPALQINMVYLYASMLVMSFFVMLYAFLQVIEKIKQR